jgi:N-acylneuraminate cytidylyltransferase
MTVAEFPSEIQRALTIGKDFKLDSIDKKQEFTRSQDLKKHFYDAGQLYWGYTKNWLEKNSIHEYSLAYVRPKWTAVDINSESDWEHAELLFGLLRKSEGK